MSQERLECRLSINTRAQWDAGSSTGNDECVDVVVDNLALL
jgi:hypothetical protein